MNTSITLTPNQLAQIVIDHLAANGISADTMALYLNGELVGYDTIVIPIILNNENRQKNDFLDRMLNPLKETQDAVTKAGKQLG